jgi:transposase-like protein
VILLLPARESKRSGRQSSGFSPNDAGSSSRAPSVGRKTSSLAQRYGLSRTTVTKWRSRTTTDDAPMGPSAPHSTVLTPAEEAMVVEFRRRMLRIHPARAAEWLDQAAAALA